MNDPSTQFRPSDADSPAWRLLNRDGTFNIARIGRRKGQGRDLYHALLACSWPRFLGLIVVVYFLVNGIFATLYTACGPGALEGVEMTAFRDRFYHAFFFSVQTFATIGYGRMSPVGLIPNFLVTLEALFGLLGFALATGLLFARFSRPTARVVFSKVAVVNDHDGVPSFIFRLANERLNQIVEAQLRVTLSLLETTSEGEHYRNFYELELERSSTPILVMSWTVVHPLNERSPLFQLSPEFLRDRQAEIMASLTGFDNTFAQTIHSRFSYTPNEILWGKRFKDMIFPSADRINRVDLNRIHDVDDI